MIEKENEAWSSRKKSSLERKTQVVTIIKSGRGKKFEKSEVIKNGNGQTFGCNLQKQNV